MSAPDPPKVDLWSKFDQSDLNSAIKVLEAISDTPDLKCYGALNPDMKRLLFTLNKQFGENRNKIAKARKRKHDSAVSEQTGIRKLRKVGVMRSFPNGSLAGVLEYGAKNIASAPLPAIAAQKNLMSGSPEPTSGQDEQIPKSLFNARNCHVCMSPYTLLHHFYDRLCPKCGDFNFAKRMSIADLTGRVCLVTGGRVKIGYCIALQLLRSNASKVIVTTRFPNNAASRFAAEADFNTFKSRLVIIGVDFRSLAMVHRFCDYIKTTYSRLDVLINNAAQTVRKPPAFYEHLMEEELRCDVDWGGIEVLASTSDQKVLKYTSNQTALVPLPTSLPLQSMQSMQLDTSAALSQIPLIPEDILTTSEKHGLFPPGKLDRHLQQVDYRPVNSWVLDIGQVSTVEFVECQTINSSAPWVLISELKELMESTGPIEEKSVLGDAPKWDKYIVNVSAMEGQFNRLKSTHHPHTNMAKAALNMLTRTSAAGFAQVDIFMTAVDTGWVTNELPLHPGETEFTRPQPPLDEVDGAMRVLDPVFNGINGGKKVWGVFLKDYKVTKW
ncbi:UNVERIFIED_CONTAM: hypothetical protein HDU68_010711 [Siphonaria sp. JEL0065]|nr:hypothetical protein HDU68_010711 [Siphonaria sp. JEL0065]